MSNKLFLVSAALALCFVLTNASIYRTVVEFEEDDATNPQHQGQKCQREFQQAQHLRSCQQFMRQQMRPGRGGGPSLDELDFEDDIENQQRPQVQVLEQCCNELRQESPDCVCPTLSQAAMASLQGQQTPMRARLIYQTARNLPIFCNIPQVQVCRFQIPSFASYY